MTTSSDYSETLKSMTVRDLLSIIDHRSSLERDLLRLTFGKIQFCDKEKKKEELKEFEEMSIDKALEHLVMLDNTFENDTTCVNK